MFYKYLMDKVDKQRVSISIEEFELLEFSVYGYPGLLVDIVSKLSGQSFEVILFKKIKAINTLRKQAIRRGGVVDIQADLST